MPIALCLALFACTRPEPTPTAPAPVTVAPAPDVGSRTDVDVAAFKDLYDSTTVAVVDVRTADEFSTGHVPGARNLPVGALAPEQLADHDKAEALYLICAVGGRSSRAADQLARAGFTVVNVRGGTNAWRAAGYPLE